MKRQGLFGARQRVLAWAGFVLLAAYAPVVSWLTHDDSYLLPVAVAGMVGYALVIDDHLRRRAVRAAASIGDTGRVPDDADADRGRPLDGPGPVSLDASVDDQRPDR